MTPYLADPDVILYHGDALEVLRELPDRSVHMCATSPPFYGLRDYGVDGQIGLEESPDEWVARLVAVFAEVRRVLRDDGTLWVEIGDSYAHPAMGGTAGSSPDGPRGGRLTDTGRSPSTMGPGLKQKDLLGQPWLLAFALRADGWYLRSEIIWARPNPMPESVTDRPTKSHSTVFMLSKRPRYFYDADAIREPHTQLAFVAQVARQREREANADKCHACTGTGFESTDPEDGSRCFLCNGTGSAIGKPAPHMDSPAEGVRRFGTTTADRHLNPAGANARSVWQLPTEPTPFAHFATWPRKLVARMILAGTSERGCCPECGAPWVRDVERERFATRPGNKSKFSRGDTDEVVRSAGQGSSPGNTAFGLATRTMSKVTTLGWSPSCACLEDVGEHVGEEYQHPAPVPCTVLDPFAGSGTTLLVARHHGRHSIGIELNEQYLEIAAKRLQQLSLLAEGAA